MNEDPIQKLRQKRLLEEDLGLVLRAYGEETNEERKVILSSAIIQLEKQIERIEDGL